ncbi:hypothetical protein F5884DRAFT_366350 [Xylogone sp. PMI_703]|nr:hypothetical protein F5884DRAFT_366350 [Xylogone sp. PMI_703]
MPLGSARLQCFPSLLLSFPAWRPRAKAYYSTGTVQCYRASYCGIGAIVASVSVVCGWRKPPLSLHWPNVSQCSSARPLVAQRSLHGPRFPPITAHLTTPGAEQKLTMGSRSRASARVTPYHWELAWLLWQLSSLFFFLLALALSSPPQPLQTSSIIIHIPRSCFAPALHCHLIHSASNRSSVAAHIFIDV